MTFAIRLFEPFGTRCFCLVAFIDGTLFSVPEVCRPVYSPISEPDVVPETAESLVEIFPEPEVADASPENEQDSFGIFPDDMEWLNTPAG